MSNIRTIIENYTESARGDRQKLICGVGINDADYVVKKSKYIIQENGKRVKKNLWICPFYEKWKSMIDRCYNPFIMEKYTNYKDTVVCEEWKRFSNFKAWMEKQDWQFKHLDKDLLGEGSIYSPGVCIFLEPEINTFITSTGRQKPSGLKTGVHFKRNKYRAVIRDSNKYVNLGTFDSEYEAHLVWYKAKLEIARVLIDKYKLSKEVSKALISKVEQFYEDQ